MSNPPKILIASDHAGYALKKALLHFLREHSYTVEDLGCDSETSVDYPDFAYRLAERISQGLAGRGILVCGSGIGMSITANKFRGVRAAVVRDVYSAKMTRLHNDANVLCLGGRFTALGLAEEIVRIFLETSFEGGRHEHRLEKLRKIEKENLK